MYSCPSSQEKSKKGPLLRFFFWGELAAVHRLASSMLLIHLWKREEQYQPNPQAFSVPSNMDPMWRHWKWLAQTLSWTASSLSFSSDLVRGVHARARARKPWAAKPRDARNEGGSPGLSCLAPSVTRVSRAFCSTDQEKKDTARGLTPSQTLFGQRCKRECLQTRLGRN